MVLQEARAAGCRTSAEAERYLVQKRRRVAEENALRTKESALQVGPSSQAVPNALMSPDSTGKDISARPATSSSVNEIDVTGYYGADLLSEPVSNLFPKTLVTDPCYWFSNVAIR